MPRLGVSQLVQIQTEEISMKKMGRPTINTEDRKSEFVPIRMTTQLRNAAIEQAEKEGIQVSELIRTALSDYLRRK